MPLNGDTTRLALAEGLTKQEKAIAREMNHRAENLPGTQKVRQVMGHRHWGARVNYGDCLFFTISPNERMSAFVLKLSRYRQEDPCLKYETEDWKRLCGMEVPALAAKRRRRMLGDAEAEEERGGGIVVIKRKPYVRRTKFFLGRVWAKGISEAVCCAERTRNYSYSARASG